MSLLMMARRRLSCKADLCIPVSSVRWSSTYLSSFTKISRYRDPRKGVKWYLSLFCPPSTQLCFSSESHTWPSQCITNLGASYMQLDFLLGHVAFMSSQLLVWMLFLILSSRVVAVFQFHWKLSSLYGSFFL